MKNLDIHCEPFQCWFINVTKTNRDLLEDGALEGASTVACTCEIPG